MAPIEADNTSALTRQIQDALAGNSALREGLSDADALPLVDWGAAQAETLAQRLAAGSPPDHDAVANAAYTLGRLMTRLTWVVTYRYKKDDAWLTRTFAKINALSRELFGPDARTLSDAEIAAWLAEHPQHEDGALLRGLLARLAPADSAAPPADEGSLLAPDNDPPAPDDAPPPLSPLPPGDTIL